MNQPIYWLIAGVNGSGKSTFYEIELEKNPILKTIKRINPDEILHNFGGDWLSSKDQFKSGKNAVKLIKKYLTNKISFNQETTFAGNSFLHLKRIQTARKLGFRIYLTYVGIHSIKLAKNCTSCVKRWPRYSK
ncbi:MAG: hypothetical protein LBT69_03195 [Lactobacillales bacterium]|nr:hypothetical protein [Lactobacillales bacterium]